MSIIVYQKYGKFWSISLGHFMKHKYLFSLEWVWFFVSLFLLTLLLIYRNQLLFYGILKKDVICKRWETLIIYGPWIAHWTLLRNKRFLLKFLTPQNASKFAIFLWKENPKLLFLFYILCYYIFSPNECPGLCRHRPEH